jgi:hypothetical protein
MASPVRNGRYLNSRYRCSPDDNYDLATLWRREEPLAYVVVRRPAAVSDHRLKGLRVAVLSDMLFSASSPGVGSAALSAAQVLAKQNHADVLLATASHPAVIRVLRSNGFLGIPGNLRFLVRDSDESLPGQLDAWWLMRGDAESDATF